MDFQHTLQFQPKMNQSQFGYLQMHILLILHLVDIFTMDKTF